MTIPHILRLLPVFAFITLFGHAAQAAPKAVPKTFSGTYDASGFGGATVNGVNINRGYDGKVKISATGALSGRINVTERKYLDDVIKEKTSRVRVSGKISRVRATTHGGYKVLVATTRIKLSDGMTGTLTVYYPYTVPTAGMSGSGDIKSGAFTGSMMLQKAP